jgi:glycosyltransferase involved in cell wall biosynthesis
MVSRESVSDQFAPEVSVVITCYNYGGYVADCIDSVLGQSYSNYEVVIVNDGSTDNSEYEINRFLADSRIVYVKQKNAGQAKALNVGIEKARGRFVAFLDADDLWEKTKLEKQIPLFMNAGVGVVYSRASFIDQQGRPVKFQLNPKRFEPRANLVTEYLITENFVPFCSSVVRKECLEDVGWIDESLTTGTDWDLWLRISTRYKFAYVNEPLAFYRMHPTQMSRNTEEMQKSADKIMANFLKRHPGAASRRAIRRAKAYTYCNRAEVFRASNRRKAWRFYFKAIKENPFDGSAYRGLIGSALAMLVPDRA